MQHLDPRHQSFLTEILAKQAHIPVGTAADGATVELDHLYVIPPNTTLTIADGVLRLRPLRVGNGLTSRSIFCSARSLRTKGIAQSGWFYRVRIPMVRQGLEKIKAGGGITMAQEPASAKFDGMPKSAIGAQ